MTGENFGMIRLGVQKLSSGNLDGGRKKNSDKTIRHFRWGMPIYDGGKFT